MKALIVPVTPFQQNCSVLVCEKTNKAAVVDPGGEVERILEAVRESGAEVEKILLTHGHLDHVGGVADLAEQLGVPVIGPHRDESFWLDMLAQQAQMMGFPAPRDFTPDQWLEEGDVVEVGELRFEVIHCPGHTPGHVVFFERGERLAVVGDVLFQGSIGRTDFPRGDHETLVNAIREKLFPLGDDVQFIPGHGPTSTFGAERRSNPFVGSAVYG